MNQNSPSFGPGSTCTDSAAHAQLVSLDEAGAALLGRQGYVPFSPLLATAFADRLPGEVDRLAAEGLLTAPADRRVHGEPTELIVNLGTVAGATLDAPIFRRSPVLDALFRALQNFGRSFNALRPVLLANGVTPEEAPELAVEGMELNVNRVQPPWSGLHPHQDHHRFTAAAQRLSADTLRHAAVRGRVFTVSGYARRTRADGSPANDLGGALTFYVRRGVRGPEDKAVHDVVAADHNTGAAFFAHTLHGVSRMTAPGSVRYSFQAFYPSRTAWEAIAKRIAGGELAAGRPNPLDNNR